MNAIKVTKAGLTRETETVLVKISAEVKPMGETCAFLPLPGKFLQFLSILRDNDLTYTFTDGKGAGR